MQRLLLIAACLGVACSVNRLDAEGQCPEGEALVGFNSDGEPLCTSTGASGLKVGEGLSFDSATNTLFLDIANRALPDRYRDGLEVSTTSSSTITVAAGRARDSADTMNLELTNSATASLGNTEDRDVVSQDAAWHWVWLIGDSTGEEVTRPYISTSALSPQYPNGYDIGRLLGAARFDGPNYRKSRQVASGQAIHVFQDQFVLAADAAWTPALRDLDASAVGPPGTQSITVAVQMTSAAPANVHFVDMLTGLAISGATPAGQGDRSQVTAPVHGGVVQVRYDGTGPVDMNITCLGYEWGPQEPR